MSSLPARWTLQALTGPAVLSLALALSQVNAATSLRGKPLGKSSKKGLPAVTLRAVNHGYHNLPVTVLLPEGSSPLARNAAVWNVHAQDGVLLPAQAEDVEGRVRLTFVVPDLPQGTTRRYQVEANKGQAAPPVVKVVTKEKDIEIEVQAALFTRYATRIAPNKPCFYPILTPEGKPFTRRWPFEQNTQESHDHPHHRGLWFTHGAVNGIDFWSEENTDKVKVGKTVATGFERLTSGPIAGGFRTHTAWRTPEDKQIATDVRDIRIYRLPDGLRLLDFDITLKPEGEPLVFGDTKEGMFGLRLPDSLAPSPDKSAKIDVPTGHIESASGLKNKNVWGKPNDWIDNYGPIDGKTEGVAMFDHPQNLRHPETWHARDYGLFAVNPFALHDFGMGAKGAGDYIVPADKTLTLRYRLVFHEGDTAAAHIADQYQNYADPPEITLK